jgi:hypothetical protein
MLSRDFCVDNYTEIYANEIYEPAKVIFNQSGGFESVEQL